MKLSEQQFKPLFLMLLEWATTTHSDGACALFVDLLLLHV